MTVRSKIAMVMAEFLGTGILATAVINVARSQIGIGYFVAFSVAIAFAVTTLIFGSISGAHFNPAVTIGMWTIRKIKTLQALAFIAAQMLGGLAAWRLAQYFTGQTISNIAGKSFNWKVAVAEMTGTAIFTMGIAAAAYQRYEGGKLAATVGMSLFAGVIIASLASNAQLNPAIALANQSWGRAYIFAPIVGSIVGMNLYALLFAPSRTTTASTASVKVEVVEPAKRVTTRKKATAKKKPAARRK
jgi:glycerol uptake facilitator-like aquaporin